ncbi:ribosome maturation factor RimM [Rothia sp. HC945]|uniref:ribosome maturation factor RimM n=1 Tax=Rothia sp. HC945 TaxID=3171170 RepID=UPI00264D9B85|nr:ribosome maturation factor RimM [Kocuria sp.]MDN5653858.1 ribosome maturation factor RimM [Kocuria sp.]
MQVQVARIGKPHGIKGEVTVQLYTDDPSTRLVSGATLRIEPSTPLAPSGQVRIRSARWNKNILVLALDEVTTRNDAEALRNHTLVTDTEEVEDTEGYYEHELIGLDVYSVPSPDVTELTHRIGRVTGLTTGSTQDLLAVELDNGTESLIPFVEELVPDVDQDQGFVVVCPPPGLLELNAEADVETDTDASGRGNTE